MPNGSGGGTNTALVPLVYGGGGSGGGGAGRPVDDTLTINESAKPQKRSNYLWILIAILVYYLMTQKNEG